MRRAIVAVLVVGVVSIAAGCASELDTGSSVDTTATAAAAGAAQATQVVSDTPAPTPTPTPTQTPPRVFEVGDTISTAAGNTLVLHRTKTDISSDVWSPAEGHRYYAVDVEGCSAAGNTEAVALNPFDFAIQMPDNTRYSADIGIVEPALGHTELPPGDCVRGWVTFEIPAGVAPATLNFAPMLSGTAIKWSLRSTAE